MKTSLLFATLVLAFGLSVGCSDDKKGNGKSGDGDGAGGGGTVTCAANEVYSDYYGECLVVNSCPANQGVRPGGFDCIPLEPGTSVYASMNITNGRGFAALLESYGYSSGYRVCTDNRDNSLFGFWFGIGNQDCNTYDNATIYIEFSDEEIAANNSTTAIAYISASSNLGGQINMTLPLGRVAEVRRANQDTEFAMQGTLDKMVQPIDLGRWEIKGDTIDIYDQGGTNLQLLWEGTVVGTASAPLY